MRRVVTLLLRYRESLRLCSQWHKFCSHIAIAADGLHGKAEFTAPRQPACRITNMPGNAVLLEHAAVVPVSYQHVLYTEFVQDVHFPRTVRIVYHPVGLGIGRKIAITKHGNVLNADDDSAPMMVAIMVLIAVAVAVATLVLQPCQHAVTLLLCLRRQRWQRPRLKTVIVAQ